MKQLNQTLRISITLMALIAVVSVSRAVAAPPGNSPLTGTWNCQSHGGSFGRMNFTLDLQQNGHDVTGYVSSPIGAGPIASGTFKNHKLQIRIEGQNTEYFLTAIYRGGTLAGEWHKPNGDKGTWQGEKSKQ